MIRTANFVRTTVATAFLAGASLFVGLNALNSGKKDFDRFIDSKMITEPNNTTTDSQPISNETKAYATMFTLGLLGTGVAAKGRKKAKEHNSSLNNIITGGDVKVKFEDKQTISLLGKYDIPITASKFTLPGYSKEQIAEVVAMTFSEDFKPKSLSQKDLENPEVKIFQDEIVGAIKYLEVGIAKRLQEETGIKEVDAGMDASDICRASRGMSNEIKEEFINFYLEKGRESFLYPKTSVIDTCKFQKDFLETHGLSIVVCKSNNVDTDLDDVGNAEKYDKIIVTDTDGKELVFDKIYESPEILNEITKTLYANNWKCEP